MSEAEVIIYGVFTLLCGLFIGLNIKKEAHVNKQIRKMIKDIKRLAKECPKAGKEEMLDLLALEIDFDNALKKINRKKIVPDITPDTTIYYVHEESLDGGYYWDTDSNNPVFSGTEAECAVYCMEQNEIDKDF